MRRVLLLLIAAIALASCAEAEVSDDPPPTTTQPPPATTLPGETTIPATGTGLQDLIEQSVADLASRLGVGVAEIKVESAEEVTWTDGSIGCPQPGFMYTQALEEGVLVVLLHKGEEYDYHQGGSGKVFWCASPGDGKFIKPLAPP